MAALAAFAPQILFASAALSAVSAVRQGQAAKAAGQYNAAAAARNAALARTQAAADAEAQSRHAQRVIGAARANYGASGVTIEGSPLDVLEMSAANAELDRQNILYKGELRATGYEDTAALELRAGDAAESRGYEQAGSAILMGAGRYASTRPAKPATTGYQFQE